MKRNIEAAAAALLCAFVVCQPVNAQMTSPPEKPARPIPFHGMISAVDQNAKTFTISGKEKSRVFKVTEKTKITKAGKAAAIKDIVENQEASGAAWQNPDGTLEAKLVKLGPAEKSKAPTPTASAKP
jgi:hypothetical protein